MKVIIKCFMLTVMLLEANKVKAQQQIDMSLVGDIIEILDISLNSKQDELTVDLKNIPGDPGVPDITYTIHLSLVRPFIGGYFELPETLKVIHLKGNMTRLQQLLQDQEKLLKAVIHFCKHKLAKDYGNKPEDSDED